MRRAGHFLAGQGKDENPRGGCGLGEGENPQGRQNRAGQKKRVNQWIQKFDKSSQIVVENFIMHYEIDCQNHFIPSVEHVLGVPDWS